jgi:NRPS condensation-like uncharacterized protein
MGDTVIPTRFPAGNGDIAAAAMRQMLEMTLGIRLIFTERLDADVLARATRLLLDLEPVLGSWFDDKHRGEEWTRCTDVDGSALFSVKQSGDPDVDAAAFHVAPFEPKGPRLATLLLNCADHDELCVRFDHVAGDGWSAKEVTYLLAETYTRLLGDPGFVPTPRTAARPTHDDVWEALTDEQRAAAANVPPMKFSNWKMKMRRGAGKVCAVGTLTLPPERVSAVRAYAHARGATVFETLVAALIRSAASIFPPRIKVTPGVSISADTRRFAHDPALDRLANIATTQTVLFDFRNGETFDQTLQHVVDGTKPYKDCLWTVATGNGADMPTPASMRTIFAITTAMMRTFHAGALLTMNLGTLDEHRLLFGTEAPVSAVAAGPVLKAGGFPLTISYYRDALTLWLGFREKWVASDVVERYLRGIDEQLADI